MYSQCSRFCGFSGFDLKLSRCAHKCFRAIDQVLVDGMSVKFKLVFRVAILMYDLHLLHYCALTALSRACSVRSASRHTSRRHTPQYQYIVRTQQQDLAFPSLSSWNPPPDPCLSSDFASSDRPPHCCHCSDMPPSCDHAAADRVVDLNAHGGEPKPRYPSR